MKKSLLRGSLAITVTGLAALTSCSSSGEGKDVRENVTSDDHKEVQAEVSDSIQLDKGQEKSVEMKCGEGKCGEGQCG